MGNTICISATLITVLIKPGKSVGGEVKIVDKKHLSREIMKLFRNTKLKAV